MQNQLLLKVVKAHQDCARFLTNYQFRLKRTMCLIHFNQARKMLFSEQLGNQPGDKFSVFSIQGSSENVKENLALRGTAVQSSTYNSCGAAKAINGIKYSPSGIPTPEEIYTYCSITSKELNPWWRLDLLDSYSISNVIVTNRADSCCPDQTAGVEIRIGNSLENNGNNNPRCAVTSLVPAGSSVSFSCGGMEGRYVNMYIPNIQEYLTLCEVEVYGTASCEEFI
ncbi:fucolectin-1-like [Carassius auratus]|uniref:Fucolectin-1-like n=1 Tax=Carassius auratus TaxID=7957 RepID=A0A6P6P8Q3_CARAU|nr:fucolectin-1-like [Carassius auratus]